MGFGSSELVHNTCTVLSTECYPTCWRTVSHHVKPKQLSMTLSRTMKSFPEFILGNRRKNVGKRLLFQQRSIKTVDKDVSHRQHHLHYFWISLLRQFFYYPQDLNMHFQGGLPHRVKKSILTSVRDLSNGLTTVCWIVWCCAAELYRATWKR